jgi:hypothetical protein
MQTRRQFLRDCSLVATAVTLAPAALARNTDVPATLMASPSFEQFVRHLNSSFVVRAGFQVSSLTLVEANAFSAATADGEDAGNEKFSLLFRSNVLPVLQQDTYSLEHSRLGRLSIFIVPIEHADKQHRYYEAIFDRAVDPAELAVLLARAPKRISKNQLTS